MTVELKLVMGMDWDSMSELCKHLVYVGRACKKRMYIKQNVYVTISFFYVFIFEDHFEKHMENTQSYKKGYVYIYIHFI